MSNFGDATVDRLPLGRHVVMLDSNSNLGTAMKTLVSNEILSAPVWDEEQAKFLGSMDMFDLVSIFVATFKEDELNKGNINALMEKHELFASTPIKHLIDFSLRNPFVTVETGTPLDSVVRRLAGTEQQWVRRVAVVEPKRVGATSLVSIVSQSGMIAYVSRNKSILAPIRTRTVHEIITREKGHVVSVTADNKVIEAFNLMKKENVSGLAVVDHNGILIGSMSIRDLRGLLVQGGILDLSRLLYSVRQFINFLNQMSVDERHPAVSVTRYDTIERVIDIFAMVRVHRLFVVDEEYKPVGVLSRVDVLRSILQA
eukprot:Opistho-2@74761